MTETIIGNLKNRLAYVDQRHKILAENISNANKPNAKAKDLKEVDFSKFFSEQKSVALTSTNAHHLSSKKTSSKFKLNNSKDTYETQPNGNNINLEEQMQKMTSNSMDHQLLNNVYKKMISLIKLSVTNK